MKIFIIGGSGRTGRELIKQGLEMGHEITALIRNPARFRLKDPGLTVIEGNVLHPGTFEDAVKGHDVVVSALGHHRYIIRTTILSEGTKNVIAAMEKHGVRRFICITSLGIHDSMFKLGLYYTLFTIPVILLFYFLDKAKQENLIFKSNLDWTIVRPGQLHNGKKRTKYKHGPGVGSYILTKMVSRADVAHFILMQLNDTTYIRKTPGIAN
jgi:putative NADH-flavin reductase